MPQSINDESHVNFVKDNLFDSLIWTTGNDLIFWCKSNKASYIWICKFLKLRGDFSMSLFVPGEKQALELKWNNQLFYAPKWIVQNKLEVEMDNSVEWFHSQLNVANDAEENMTFDFVMKTHSNLKCWTFERNSKWKLHLNLKHQKFERNPKWKLQPSVSIEN